MPSLSIPQSPCLASSTRDGFQPNQRWTIQVLLLRWDDCRRPMTSILVTSGPSVVDVTGCWSQRPWVKSTTVGYVRVSPWLALDGTTSGDNIRGWKVCQFKRDQQGILGTDTKSSKEQICGFAWFCHWPLAGESSIGMLHGPGTMSWPPPMPKPCHSIWENASVSPQSLVSWPPTATDSLRARPCQALWGIAKLRRKTSYADLQEEADIDKFALAVAVEASERIDHFSAQGAGESMQCAQSG